MDKFPERISRRLYVDSNGCWIWTGGTRRGYGRVSFNGQPMILHRLAYLLYREEILEGLQIDHLCRVRQCCNPEHLEVVTSAENMRRKHVLITHCRRGHEYTEENTVVYPSSAGYLCRGCVTCRRTSAREYQRSRKAAMRQATAELVI